MATDQVFIYTMTQGSSRQGSWSRYIFPFTIEHYAHLGNDLYLRAGDVVHKVVEGELYDNAIGFDSTIQWPWLDFDQPGVNKMMEGFDIVGTGTSSLAVGFDQSNFADFTAEFTIPDDTYPGQIIQFPLNGPSFSVRLKYNSAQNWTWNSFNLYLTDQRPVA